MNKHERIKITLEQNTGIPFDCGNKLTLLHNGNEIFPAMLSAIAKATQRIDFVTYVYWQGDIADRFAQALAERAAAGVQVRVLLDAFGTKMMEEKLVEKIKSAGADVRWFRPLATWRVWRMDKRTHRKLLVCDNDVAFTGGVGIAKEWEGDARNCNEWRDTHLAIKGPALHSLRAAFLDNWNEAGGWSFEAEVKPIAEIPGGVPIQVVHASTTIGWTAIASLLRTLISLSEKRLRIVTAYFNPDEKLVEVIEAAHMRGVDVQLLVPGEHCDSRLSQLAGHQHVERLTRAGVSVWQYEQTMLHAKVLIVDDQISCVGSANMNHRSMAKDEECCVVALSEEINQQLNARFDADCRVAHKIDPVEWADRGRWLRYKERAARLLVEQL